MMYHSKDGILYMVQIDHLTGEQIGYAVGRFYDAGASNVQVVSSLTKKNRPSYVIFIDCRHQYADAVEALIPEELGAGGWHKILTEHHYLYNSIIERNIKVRKGNRLTAQTSGEQRKSAGAESEACGEAEARSFVYAVRGKAFENGNIRPENDSVIELQESIQEDFGVFVRYSEAYNAIMRSLYAEESDLTELVL